MKCLLFFFLLACCNSYLTAAVYKWVDDKGRTHYGDNPNEIQRKAAVNITSYESVTYSEAPSVRPVSPASQSSGKVTAKSANTRKVTMYSTAWCGYCKKAKKYFQAKGIPFVEYDIEKNAKAKKAYDALGGKGVPVIVMGKKRMNGFSEKGFEKFYR